MILETMLSLKALITALNDKDPSGYAVRFTQKNMGLKDEAFTAKWMADQADRTEAEAVESHRREKVLASVEDLDEATKQILLQKLRGVASVSGGGDGVEP